MVFSIGGPWSDTTAGSASKLNRVTVISGPGDDLTGLTKANYVIIKCTVDQTGGGLLKDHVYESSADGTSWIDISSVAVHTHSSVSQGGSYFDINRTNPLLMDSGGRYSFNTKKADWKEEPSGTGSIADDVDGTTAESSILLSTGATSGGRGQITVSGLKPDFAKRSMFQAKYRIGTLSNLALTVGVRVDSVTAVDANSAQYGAQVCTATNNNWFLRSASGTNKSQSDTGTLATTNRVAIKIEHYPDLGTPELDMYIDAATAFQKTSDMPTGVGFNGNIIRHGIKNSTNADRTLYMYDCRVRYFVSDNWV